MEKGHLNDGNLIVEVLFSFTQSGGRGEGRGGRHPCRDVCPRS